MADPYLSQITLIGCNYPPRGWAHTNGQILDINSYTALFSLLGTTYGGDGRTTFGLPDLRGRMPMHPGSGPGLPTYTYGEKGGTYEHTLTVGQMPSHSHTGKVVADGQAPNQGAPGGNTLAAGEIYNNVAPTTDMKDGTVKTDNTGGGQSFNIQNPFQGVYYIIALTGIYPPRN